MNIPVSKLKFRNFKNQAAPMTTTQISYRNKLSGVLGYVIG